MTTLKFTPEDFNLAIDNILINFREQVESHMPCICKKKIHKHCPRHNAKSVMKMVYDQRQPLGDKMLYLQAKEIPESRMIDVIHLEPPQILPLDKCKVGIEYGHSFYDDNNKK